MADNQEEIKYELTAEEATEMLQAKIAELNSTNEELNKAKNEIVNIKSRALKVHEENQLLQFSPQYAEQAAEMKFHLAMAKQFTASGAFPKYNPEQIYTLIKAGSEMNMKPLESLSSLYIVNGKIEPYGKGMLAILTKNGYRIKYSNETATSCTVTVTGTDFEGTETVTTDDPVLKRSKAMNIAPKNKLRFHAIRMLLNFQLPHLIASSADLFENDAVTANQDANGNTMVVISNEELLNQIDYAESLVVLNRIHEENKAVISKDINLVAALGKAKKKFANG